MVQELIEIYRMNEIDPKTRASLIAKMGDLINNQFGSNLTQPIVYELVLLLDPDNPLLKEKAFLAYSGENKSTKRWHRRLETFQTQYETHTVAEAAYKVLLSLDDYYNADGTLILYSRYDVGFLDYCAFVCGDNVMRDKWKKHKKNINFNI